MASEPSLTIDAVFLNGKLKPYSVDNWLKMEEPPEDLVEIHERLEGITREIEDGSPILTIMELKEWYGRIRTVQKQHDLLIARHELSFPNKWMTVLNCCLTTETWMLQRPCTRCLWFRGGTLIESCSPITIDKMGSGALPKCGNCRDRRTVCDWGKHIPKQMNKIKMAIHPELPLGITTQPDLQPEDDQGSGDDDNDKNNNIKSALKTAEAQPKKIDLLRATEAAIARACLEQEKDLDRLIDELEKFYQ